MNNSLLKYLDNLNDCVIIRRDADRTVAKAPAAKDGTPTLFIKVYRHDDFYSRLQNALHGKTCGKRDLQACTKLQELDIHVTTPVGYCDDQPNVLIARKSLFAAHWLDRISLATLINSMSGQIKITNQTDLNQAIAAVMTPGGFSVLCSGLGSFVATLHNKKVYSKDLNVGNILIEIPAPDLIRFFLTDYENISFKKQVGRKKSLSNIIQVCAALMQVDALACKDFCSGYAEIRQHFNVLELEDYIREKARQRGALWKEKIDGNFERIADALKARKA